MNGNESRDYTKAAGNKKSAGAVVRRMAFALCCLIILAGFMPGVPSQAASGKAIPLQT